MKKRILALCLAALLCAALAVVAAVPAFGYAEGVNAALPRVVDNAGLLTSAERSQLDTRLRGLIGQYRQDIVIVTERGIGAKTPAQYADDFFDYGGYGWHDAEDTDITEGSGILLLVNMAGPGNSDLYLGTKGRAIKLFSDSAVNRILDNMVDQLRAEDYAGAFGRFLDDAEKQFNAQKSAGGKVFLFGILIALVMAWLIVRSMKRKLNTARPQAAAMNYMTQGSFRLTQQQDIFLYSNTTRTAKPQQTSSGGGGGHTSSSGSHHSSSSRKF